MVDNGVDAKVFMNTSSAALGEEREHSSVDTAQRMLVSLAPAIAQYINIEAVDRRGLVDSLNAEESLKTAVQIFYVALSS
jgi:hypothetical protein